MNNKKLLILLCFAVIPLLACEAKKITINVLPTDAKIYVDGQLVATGNYTVKFNRNTDFYLITVEAPGYITRNYRLLKSNPKKTVLYTLPEDEANSNSIGDGEEGSDIANKWFDVTCRKGLTEDVVWKRLMNVSTSYFSNIEVRDKSAGWIKTGWRLTKFTYQTVRTRMEIRMSFVEEDVLTYRVRLLSEIKDNDCSGNNCFGTYDRVLKTFEPLIQELQTSVGGGE